MSVAPRPCYRCTGIFRPKYAEHVVCDPCVDAQLLAGPDERFTVVPEPTEAELERERQAGQATDRAGWESRS